MAGAVNDYLIYPILDLIRGELKKINSNVQGDPFSGEPSITLKRLDLKDPDRVTGVTLTYESGYVVDMFLVFGTNDPSTIPLSVDVTDPDYDYYLNDRLNEIVIYTKSPELQILSTYCISLNYDIETGVFLGTTAQRKS